MIYSMKCSKMVASVKESNSCYNGVLVEIHGEERVYQPKTRLFSDVMHVRPCFTHFPMLVQDIHQQWWRVDTPVAKVDAPASLTLHQYQDFHPADAGRSVYTQPELEAWQDLVRYPHSVQHLQEVMTRGVCQSRSECNLRPVPESPPLSLESLAKEGLDTVVEALEPSWWSKIQDGIAWVSPIGILGGCAVILYAVAAVLHRMGQRVMSFRPQKPQREATTTERPEETALVSMVAVAPTMPVLAPVINDRPFQRR